MALSNTNLSLLALVTLFLMLANKVNSQGSPCFFFPNFTGNDDLIYQGDAHVVDHGVLRLIKTDASGTYPQQNSVGRVLYCSPIQLFDSTSFISDINFVITHVNDNPADGITFFVAPPNTTIPERSEGGNLGIFYPGGCNDELVAVEFDIYDNKWDPIYRHIGIDVNSRESKNTTEWESVSGQVVNASIFYDANIKRLSVSVHADSQHYVVTYNLDLKAFLPEYVRFGISGATGHEVAILDILSWETCLYPELPARKKKEDMYVAQYV